MQKAMALLATPPAGDPDSANWPPATVRSIRLCHLVCRQFHRLAADYVSTNFSTN
jgi:hypothetical protein